MPTLLGACGRIDSFDERNSKRPRVAAKDDEIAACGIRVIGDAAVESVVGTQLVVIPLVPRVRVAG
jgi:hypothetical protein